MAIFESKNPDLTLENGHSLEIWKINGEKVTFLSDCPENYPQYYVGEMSVADMFGDNLNAMVNTGWDVIQYSEEGAKLLRMINPKLAKKIIVGENQ